MEKKSGKKEKVKALMPIILGAVVVAGAIIGGTSLYHSRRFISTDNAQIDSDISPISARVGGFVKAIRFADNQYVKAGDTLLIVEDDDYRIRLDQALAAWEAAKVNTNISMESAQSSLANVPTAQNNIEAAKIRLWKATEDFNRCTTLMANQATTQEKLDAAKAEKDAAETQLSAMEHQLSGVSKLASVAQKQIGGAVVAIRQRAIDVEYAKLQLSYTVIIAPVSGIVSKRAVQPGQLLQVGSPICTIVNSDGLYVTANFKETQMRKMKVGAQVTITVDAFPGRSLQGAVSSICGATGSKFSMLPPDNATGNFVKVVQRIPVKITLDPKALDHAPLLRTGMSVVVEVRAL